MIEPNEYPVYNHRERPGIGRDHLGDTFYNCFSIKLEQDENSLYRPYLFSDFIHQYNQYTKYSATCNSCISEHKILVFPADGNNIDRPLIYKKFNDDIVDDKFYYCPLMQQILSASELSIELADSKNVKEPPVTPIPAILSGIPRGHDDEYFFEFKNISPPQTLDSCSMLQEILSHQFIPTLAEQSFFTLWFLTMFYQMNLVLETGQHVYLEDGDFDVLSNKLYRFLFPIPQVWVYIIPKLPPGMDWKAWEKGHKQESLPQRVDFLFVYEEKKHIVEIDDRNHYAEQINGQWVPSGKRYRQTLSDTRWLNMCGFEVHRFTNEELLELYHPNSGKPPDIMGFAKLLRTVNLEPQKLVFLR